MSHDKWKHNEKKCALKLTTKLNTYRNYDTTFMGVSFHLSISILLSLISPLNVLKQGLNIKIKVQY